MAKDIIYLYQVVTIEFDWNGDIEEHSQYVHKTYKKAIDELYVLGYRYKKISRIDEIEYFYKKKEEERTQKDDKAYIRKLGLDKTEV